MPKQISTVSSQQHKGGAYLLKPSFQQFWILYVIISVLISKELVLDLSVCHINSKKKKKNPQIIKLGFIGWVQLIFILHCYHRIAEMGRAFGHPVVQALCSEQD